MFIYTDISIIVSVLVTISPTRLLLTMGPNIRPLLVELIQIVLSAAFLVLSKIVQFNVAFVPSQNVALAGC